MMKKAVSPGKLYVYYSVLISFQIFSGGWFWYILTNDEPSIWQSGTLAFGMILPIGLLCGGLLNGYFLWRLFKNILNRPVFLSLLALLMPLWLAILLLLLNTLLFAVIG